MTEHKIEVVPLLATIGNALEIKCDITDTRDVVWERNDVDVSLLDFPGITVRLPWQQNVPEMGWLVDDTDWLSQHTH